MQRHPENEQHHEHGADAVDDSAVRTVANSSLAIGTGPVSLTRAPYSPARLRSLAACRMASVASLPGSSALKSRIGLNSMKARRSESVKGLSLTSSRQENVPEPVFSTFSTVCGDQR